MLEAGMGAARGEEMKRARAMKVVVCIVCEGVSGCGARLGLKR